MARREREILSGGCETASVGVSERFIAGLPKVELHVHHVGSVPLRAVAELAARHPGTVPSDLDQLARFFVFEDFPHFIRNYLAVVALIKTAEDVRLPPLALHRFLTVCTRCNLCRPHATYVYVGCDTGA